MSRTSIGRPHRLPLLAVTLVAALVLPGSIQAGGRPIGVPAARPGVSIIVTYRDDPSFRRAGSRSAAAQAHASPEIRTKIFRPTRGQEQKAMRQLAADPGVVAIENDVEVESTLLPNDRYWSSYNRWAHDQLKVTRAWDTTRGSSGTIIAILDSGLQTNHPEFSGRIVAPYDFVGRDSVPNDPRGHGTMSTGAAAARGNNSIGVAGACWKCRIMPVRVLDAQGTGKASNIIRGIVYAANRGARVVTMSFGGFAATTAMQNAITYARNKGAVVLASAGNAGTTRRFYPAAYSGVISVAANDAAGRVYSWSTRGSWVKLTAPGCLWSTKTGSTYGNFCGTSASAPLVAGLVGLLRSARPKATRAQVEKALLGTATKVGYVAKGRPNAIAALKALGVAVVSPPPATPNPTPAPTPTATPNPTPAPTPSVPAGPAWVEAGGTVVIEAEAANERVTRSGRSWQDGDWLAGYAGAGYVSARPDSGTRIEDPRFAPVMRYVVSFATPGIYRIWARVAAPDSNGNSINVGLDDLLVSGGQRVSEERVFGTWAWTGTTSNNRVATLTVPSAGIHVVDVWMREDGIRLDRLVLTKSGESPTGTGPEASNRTNR